MGIKRDIFWRIAVSYFLVLAFGIAILFKIFKTQQIEGKYWRALSDSLTTQMRPIDAERGSIYSFDGRLLATSLPVFEIRLDLKADGLTKEVWDKNIGALATELANLFGDKSAKDYKRELNLARAHNARYYLLKKEITYPDYLKLKKFPLFDLGQNGGGLIAIKKNKRQYPYQWLANRTIGYARDNNVQPVGLEGTFNTQLSGVEGSTLMRKYAGGIWLPVNEGNILEPQNGKDIITTLDVNLQDVAENALLKTLVKNNADHGSVIVMEVSTGAIKAIANLGLDTDGKYKELFNYAAGEAREPGSTFKLASMIALFEDGYETPTDMVDVEKGTKRYFSQTMRDAEAHNLTLITVKSAFAHSSNVGISKLIYDNYNQEPEKFLKHLRDLKLDQKISLEIPGVAFPYIKNTKDKTWSRYSLPWMSVGYELKVTPLQTITLYNAVANNGKMMKPYLVSDVKEYGKILEHFDPEVLQEKICSEKTLGYLKELLEDVVIEGTAKNLQSSQYKIAGKTGTAQVADHTTKYGEVYQSSFVGYFPADHPEYTCIVVVYNPRNGIYYGSAVAGPVFKEISDKVYSSSLELRDSVPQQISFYVALQQLKPGSATDISYLLASLNQTKIPIPQNTEWLSVSNGSVNPQLNSETIVEQETIVPDVQGMGLKDALFLLENAGLDVEVIGAGSVRSQSIQPNQKITKGQIITITLATR